MIKSKKVERKLYKGVGKFKPLNLGNFIPLLTCADDGLAGMRMSVNGFAILASIVKSAAQETCGGKVVAVLEGGYDLRLLPRCVAAIIDVFMGSEPERKEAFELNPRVRHRLEEIKKVQSEYWPID